MPAAVQPNHLRPLGHIEIEHPARVALVHRRIGRRDDRHPLPGGPRDLRAIAPILHDRLVQARLGDRQLHRTLHPVGRDTAVTPCERLALAACTLAADLPKFNANVAPIAIVGDQPAGDPQFERRRGLVEESEKGLLLAARPRLARLDRGKTQRLGRHKIAAELNGVKIELRQWISLDAFPQQRGQLVCAERLARLPGILALGNVELRARRDAHALVTTGQVAVERFGVDEHRRPHPVGVADQLLKSSLPRWPLRLRITLVEIDIAGVEHQIVDPRPNVRVAGQAAGLVEGAEHPAKLVAEHQVGLRCVELPVELGHRLFRRPERPSEKVVDQRVEPPGFIHIPEHSGSKVIAQAVGTPVVARLGRHEARAPAMGLGNRSFQILEIRAAGLGRHVAVPRVHTVVFANSQGRSLARPAVEDLVERKATFKKRRGHAHHDLPVGADTWRRAVEIVGIQANQLAGILPVHPGGHLVGQEQCAVGDAPQLFTAFALAPAAAVARVGRDAVGRRLAVEQADGIFDHQPPQLRITDAELRLTADVALSANQGVELGMLVELGLEAADEAAVGVARSQLDARGGPIACAPLGIRCGVVIPDSEAVPDPPGDVVGRLLRVEGHRQFRNPRHDLPMFARHELPVPQAIQEIPDGMFHGKLGGPHEVDALRAGPQQVVFPLGGLGIEPPPGQLKFGKSSGKPHGDPVAARGGVYVKLGPGDPREVVTQGRCRCPGSLRGIFANDDRQERSPASRQSHRGRLPPGRRRTGLNAACRRDERGNQQTPKDRSHGSSFAVCRRCNQCRLRDAEKQRRGE